MDVCLAVFSLFWGCLSAEIVTLDMSYEYIENVTYFIFPEHYLKLHPDIYNGRNPETGTWYTGYKLELGEHGGTHMDAPHHMYEKGLTLGKIPLSRLLQLPLAVVDLTEKVEKNRDYQFATEDFIEWEKKYGRIPEGGVVFVRSGWSQYYPGREAYLGSKTNNWQTDYHFPGFNKDAATWLAVNRKIYGAGTEAASLDAGQALKEHKAHINFFSQGVWGVECVANLDKVPPTGARVNLLPIKLAAGSGGATRIYATWDTTGSACKKQGTVLLLLGLVALVVYWIQL